MADAPIPDRRSVRAVLLKMDGLGWRIGIGSIAAGEIESDGRGFQAERMAERAARALADRHDLLLLRA